MPPVTVKQPSGSVFGNKTRTYWFSSLGFSRRHLKKVAQVVLSAIIPLWAPYFVLTYQPLAQAQTLQVRFNVKTVSPHRLQVEIQFPNATDTLSFRNSYGSVLGLAQRIENVSGTSSTGERVQVEKRGVGEFRSARKIDRFSYEVNLIEPSRLEDRSHVSWLGSTHGLLLPSDLLPRPIGLPVSFSDTRISIDLPTGWTISSAVQRNANLEFVTSEPDKAVFLVGSDLREENRGFNPIKFRLITAGQWSFSNGEVMKLARKILEDYGRVTGSEPLKTPTLILIPFPKGVGAEKWTAEARGNSVVMLVADSGRGKQLVNRIGILLSHELFHLWVPSGLKLEGDYDWFFEGFTLYQALVADVRLGLISFDDFLETIGRVYQSYLANPQKDRLSLIEASTTRWTTSSSLVYDKGMLVAFIYDLAVRWGSNCSASLNDVYRELFRSHPTGQGNANESIIRILKARTGTEPLVTLYVEGRSQLNLESIIEGYGLVVKLTDARPSLKVQSSLNDPQRRLLKCVVN